MPCTAPARGKTDLINPWEPLTDNDPCGVKKLVRAGALPPLSDNPLGAWPLGDGGAAAVDLRGQYPGVYPVGPTTVDGPFLGTRASRFAGGSGSPDMVTVPAPGSALSMGDVFTIMFWIRLLVAPTVASGNVNYCFGKPFHQIIRLKNAGGVFPVYFALYGSGGDVQTSTVSLQQGRWQHVCATKSGAVSNLYLDGVDVSGAITNFTMNNTIDRPIYIGGYTGVTGANAEMYDVRCYNTALPAARVAEYALGKDASADNLCPGHYAMKYGALSGPGAMIAQEP